MITCHTLSISRFLCFARVKILLAFLRRVFALADGIVDCNVKVSGLSGFTLYFLWPI